MRWPVGITEQSGWHILRCCVVVVSINPLVRHLVLGTGFKPMLLPQGRHVGHCVTSQQCWALPYPKSQGCGTPWMSCSHREVWSGTPARWAWARFQHSLRPHKRAAHVYPFPLGFMGCVLTRQRSRFLSGIFLRHMHIAFSLFKLFSITYPESFKRDNL